MTPDWLSPIGLHLSASHILPPTLVIAVFSSLFLVALAGMALLRRRTKPYLLVTLALVALLARSVVGIFALYGFVPIMIHHVVEHVMDVVTVALLVTAIYQARSVSPPQPDQA